MKPVLFEFLGIKIYGYGAMLTVAIISALVLLEKRAEKKGYDLDKISNLYMISILSGILGGKLLFLITEFKNIKYDKSLLTNLGYGFVIYGAIIGGALGIYVYCKKHKWNVLSILDLVIPSVALGQGFGRIGCFLAGCCFGKPTNLPIGVEFKSNLFAPVGVHLHPTQLYSSVFDFLLALFLIKYDEKEHEEGRVFSMYFILYSIGRFIVEFFRGDPRGSVDVLSTSQFISIFTLIFGLILFNIHKIKIKKD